jgi:hypothetical protein
MQGVHIVAKTALTKSRFDLEKIGRDNRKLRPSVVRSEKGQESTKCREIGTVKHT